MTNLETEYGTDSTTMVLCWIPETNKVSLLPLGGFIPSDYYTDLACHEDIQGMSFAERQQRVFSAAMKLIIRDRCDPDAVHRAFLDLDEYRDGCANDMPGVVSYNPQEH